MNIMNLFLAKMVAENQGVPSDRAMQLGMVASMMPGQQGLLIALMMARNEAAQTTTAIASKALAVSNGLRYETPNCGEKSSVSLTSGGATATAVAAPVKK